jgi:hypothetical protein
VMVDQTADVVHQHRQRRDVGMPVRGLTIPPAGMEAMQRCGPSSDVTMPNRPSGVFSGCDIANKRDGQGPDYIPLGGI